MDDKKPRRRGSRAAAPNTEPDKPPLVITFSKHAVNLESKAKAMLHQEGINVIQRVRERLSVNRARSLITLRKNGEKARLEKLMERRATYAATITHEQALRAENEEENLESKEDGEEPVDDSKEDERKDKVEHKMEEDEVEPNALASKTEECNDENQETKTVSEDTLDENAALDVEDHVIDMLVNEISCVDSEHIVSLLCEGDTMKCRRLLASENWTELMAESDAFQNPIAIEMAETDTEAKHEEEETSESKHSEQVDRETHNARAKAYKGLLVWCGSSEEENSLLYQFLFCPPQLNDSDLLLSKQKALASQKCTMVSMEQLIRFVFPVNLQHPLSTGRLVVFGQYGPLDHNSNLCSGYLGSHVVRKHELVAMVKQIDTEDLLQVYSQGEVLTPDVQREVLRQAGENLRNVPQLTEREVHKLFEDLPRSQDGKLCFHEMQQVILEFRQKRIADLKRISVVGNANSKAKTRKEFSKDELLAVRQHELAVQAASIEAVKPRPKIKDSQRFSVVTQMLNRNTHKITTIEDKNHPSLVHNVRILRDEVYMPGMVRWENNCRVKKK